MKTKQLLQGALIAAIYTILTLAVAPISSGLMQCRISEALCILPFFTPAAVPGLFVGCLLSNLLMGAVVYDVIFGSLATLIAACLTLALKQHGWSKYLAPAPAVLCNALIIGWLLSDIYQVGVSFSLCALYVGAGEALACYVGGLPLLLLLERFKLF